MTARRVVLLLLLALVAVQATGCAKCQVRSFRTCKAAKK
jgi:hypothetical protein